MQMFNYRVWPAICMALLLGACADTPAAPTATTDYDHSYDFSHVHSIAIQPIPRDTVATMMISDAQISRIDQALRDELRRRGFEVVALNSEADMYLAWKFLPRERDDVSTFDPATQHIYQGTLYVTMIDPVMLQPEWRATFKADLRNQPDTEAAAEYRQQAAQAILARFPPAPATP